MFLVFLLFGWVISIPVTFCLFSNPYSFSLLLTKKYKMAIHLFIKFACENREFQIQLTKQASLNLEKENLPQGEQGREKGFLFTETGDVF